VGVSDNDSGCKGEAWESEDVVQQAGLEIDDGDPGVWGFRMRCGKCREKRWRWCCSREVVMLCDAVEEERPRQLDGMPTWGRRCWQGCLLAVDLCLLLSTLD